MQDCLSEDRRQRRKCQGIHHRATAVWNTCAASNVKACAATANISVDELPIAHNTHKTRPRTTKSALAASFKPTVWHTGQSLTYERTNNPLPGYNCRKSNGNCSVGGCRATFGPLEQLKVAMVGMNCITSDECNITANLLPCIDLHTSRGLCVHCTLFGQCHMLFHAQHYFNLDSAPAAPTQTAGGVLHSAMIELVNLHRP